MLRAAIVWDSVSRRREGKMKLIRFRYEYNAMYFRRFDNFFRRREIVVSKAVGKLVKRVGNVSESWPKLAEPK